MIQRRLCISNPLQMSEDENNQKSEKPGPSKSTDSLRVEDKKLKKNIRFQIPIDVHSEESFSSALSYKLTDEDEDEDYEDFISKQKSVSVLKKYVLSPLHHSQPRVASLKPCFDNAMNEDDRNFFELSTSSSNQLYEVMLHSPTHGDVDLNLINSIYLRKIAAVKEAIRHGANVNICKDKQTPLMIATEIGDTRLVSYLLTVPDINPDFQNDFGQTALSVAIRNAFDRIVRVLLHHNADVNLSDNMGRSPLHLALFQKRAGLAKLLLAYGADYDKPDCFGERPMYTAAVKKPDLECLLTLLKVGATPEYYNITGIPLLSRIILYGKDNSLAYAVVHYGANVNSYDLISRKTPLHFAAITNNVEITKFLVSKGADMNKKTTYNFNPYEEAIFHGSIDVINFYADKTISAKLKTFASIKLEVSLERRKDLLRIRNLDTKKKKKTKNKRRKKTQNLKKKIK